MVGDDIYVLKTYCEIIISWILEICLFVFSLASLQTKKKFKGENNNNNKTKQKNESNTS